MIICKFFTSKLKNYGPKRLIFGTILEYDGRGYFFLNVRLGKYDGDDSGKRKLCGLNCKKNFFCLKNYILAQNMQTRCVASPRNRV